MREEDDGVEERDREERDRHREPEPIVPHRAPHVAEPNDPDPVE
jgi:hypothetical protein